MAGDVSFTPTEEDYVSAGDDWLKLRLNRPAAWRLRALLAALVWAGAFVFHGADAPMGEAALMATAWLAVAILYGIVVAGGSLTFAARRAARLFRQQKALHQQLRFSWTDEGVEIESGSFAGRMAWSELHRCAEGRSAVLLFMNEQLYYFLPKRVLGPDAASDLMRCAQRGGVPRS